MTRIKKNRLAQTHKLSSLSDHLSKTTNFSSDEVRMLLLIHQKMEEVGPLDRNRFREILSVVFAITDDVMLDLVFRAFDTDLDGYVNDIEWVKGMSTMLRGTLEQLTDFTYSVYDMNGDGSLAREELHHCLKGCIFSGYGIDDDEIEDCERDIVDIAMKKLDNDRDGQITYEDFVRAVKKDALLLQACGCCIPSTRCASAFQSLITERYHLQSALMPKMPTRKEKKSLKRTFSMKFGGGDDRDYGSRDSIVSASLADINADVLPRSSKLDHPMDAQLHRMSLSVVKNAQLMALVSGEGKIADKNRVASLWKK